MVNKKGMISVIIPIYNTERYLNDAIDSVLNQTYTNFELLLINDASTDNSRNICLEYAQRDSRIIVLDNNSDIHGPGPARNIGLDHAIGQYIYFMDSDDWIDNNLLQLAIECVQDTNADIVQFGAIYERNGENSSQQYCWRGKCLLTKDEIQGDFHVFWKEHRNWMCLFRQEVVKSIRFEDIIIGEDISYMMDALSNAEKIAYIPKALYHYRYVENSTSHRWEDTTIECRKTIWKHQINFLESFNGELDELAYAEVAYDNYIWAIYQLSSNLCTLSYSEKKEKLTDYRDTICFDKYRGIYPLNQQQGLSKIKYMLVKYRMEKIMLLFAPTFLKFFRGE